MCLNVYFIPLVVDDTFAIFLQSGSVSVEASWASYRPSVEVRLMVCSLLMIFLELKTLNHPLSYPGIKYALYLLQSSTTSQDRAREGSFTVRDALSS